LKNFLATICALLILQTVCAQQILSGVVSDSVSEKKLSFATVQLPELHLLTYSNDAGEFQFKNLPLGNFILKISYTGYETFIQTIKISSRENHLTVTLEQLAVETEEVVIYGTHQNSWKYTPMNIVSVSRSEMNERGNLSLSNALAKLPGMGEMTTGGISKPVIRGLYGNRIQTQLMGIRFDNQQWQDEHGLGLGDAGIDRVEIIKGPSALTYGSEAMGGVINIIEELPSKTGTTERNANVKFFGNTMGYAADFGIKKANDKWNWRLRLGTESHADYADGNNKRVFNTRFNGYVGKFSAGFHKAKWVTQNNYMFSLSDFGFVLKGIEAVTTYIDGRYSRSFAGPHHTVLFNILTSENTFFKGVSKIKFNIGVHSNERLEQEGGNKISLNMLLNTVNATLQRNHPMGKKGDWTLGTDAMFQNNTNFGSRIIVPDANFLESGSYFSFNIPVGKVVFEIGSRFDFKNIQTFETGTLNTVDTSLFKAPGTDILPFNHSYTTTNGAAGMCWNPKRFLNLKLNIASGFRAPNLAELSSKGLHEGTVRWEIGNPEMKSEQNFNAEIQVNTEFKNWRLNIAAYNNSINNYIYLTQTGNEYIGFSIYNYVQKNAILQGGEILLDIHPQQMQWLDLSASYSKIIGKTSDGEFLPFIPADKVNVTLRLEGDAENQQDAAKKITKPYFEIGSDYVLAQNNPAEFETVTPEYYLFNAGVGFHFKCKKSKANFSLVGNNLLNRVYYDHLSRFKYLGLNNPGRDIVLNFSINF